MLHGSDPYNKDADTGQLDSLEFQHQLGSHFYNKISEATNFLKGNVSSS